MARPAPITAGPAPDAATRLATPMALLSASEIAQWIIHDFPLVKAGEILTALAEEIEGEVMKGWLDEDGLSAEGSLQGTAAYNACAEFEAFIKTLTHRSERAPSMAEQHRLVASQLVDLKRSVRA